MAEITTREVREYLMKIEGQKTSLDKLRNEFNIVRGTKSYDAIRNIMFQLAEQGIVKPTGRVAGEYKVIIPVQPIEFSLDGEDKEGILDYRFPKSHLDDTDFGIENLVELSSGDLVLITGETNYGKTAIALSFLGENLDLLPTNVLMGSEYTSSDNHISPKLKRRLRRMDWVNWMDGNSKPRFNLLPIEADYEDYVKDYKGGLIVIDWISLPGEYYLIDQVMKTIKNGIGSGLGITVLQKNKSAEFAEGGQRSERYADLVVKIDRFGENESILTIGKVKAAKGKSPSGRMWAFGITNYGANLENIREVERCSKCWAKGYIREGQNTKRCPVCKGLKYVAKV